MVLRLRGPRLRPLVAIRRLSFPSHRRFRAGQLAAALPFCLGEFTSRTIAAQLSLGSDAAGVILLAFIRLDAESVFLNSHSFLELPFTFFQGGLYGTGRVTARLRTISNLRARLIREPCADLTARFVGFPVAREGWCARRYCLLSACAGVAFDSPCLGRRRSGCSPGLWSCHTGAGYTRSVNAH